MQRIVPFLGLLVTIGAALPAGAQTPGDTIPAAPDTTVRDTTVSARVGPSPGGAFLRSLVLPGWGQAELGSPGRGSVYFALEAASLWMVARSQQRLNSALREQDFRRETGELGEREESGLVNARKQQREDWIVLAAFWALFSAADAYVGAYLRDFDANVGARPAEGGGTELRVSVPVGP